MEDFKWDPVLKMVYDSFVWDEIEKSKQPAGENNVASDGILELIGADYMSINNDIENFERRNKNSVPLLALSKEHPPQPCCSSLTSKQHRDYLKVEEQFRHDSISVLEKGIPPKDRTGGSNFAIYKKIHRIVFLEQKEFAEYAYQDALYHMSDYNAVHPWVDAYFQHFLSLAFKRIHNYPASYINFDSLQINTFPRFSDPQMTYEKLCLILGTLPVLWRPDDGSDIPLYDSSKTQEVHQKLITEDENAEKLAATWKADIVLSLSALRTLAINSAPFTDESEMILNVREIEVDRGGKRKVIFMDKALPPKSVFGKDKAQRYFKKAVKHFILQLSEEKLKAKVGTTHGEANHKDALEEENTKEESQDEEESISQLDGADDEETMSTVAAAKKKKRISSVPSSVAQAADLSVWKRSLSNMPLKAASKHKSSSLPFNFKKSDGSSVQKKESHSSSDDSNSEDGDLVIDIEDEQNAKERTPSAELESENQSSDVVEENENFDLSFKPTNLPSEYLQSISVPEESFDDTTSPQPSSLTNPRRSLRNKSISAPEKTKEQISSKDNSKTVNKKPNLRSSKILNKVEEDSSIASERTLRTPRKRSTSEKSAAGDAKKAKQTSASRKTAGKSSTRKREKVITDDLKTSISNDLTTAQSKNVSPSLTSPDSSVQDNEVSLPKSTNKQVSKTRTSPATESGLSAKASASTKTSRSKPSTTKKKTVFDKNDLLGEILSMQKERKDKLASDEPSRKSKGSTQHMVMPEIPTPTCQDDYNFEEMLTLHNTKLSHDSSGIFYNLWSIGGIRVLIRGCVHGKINQLSSKDKPSFEYASIRTKLEYQHDLGYSFLSKSEACAEWIDLQFRPQPSCILRCRVDPLSQKLLHVEHIRNEQAVYRYYESCGFSYLMANKLLLTLFQQLTAYNTLSPSVYLLTHVNGSNQFRVSVRSSNPSTKTVEYNLRKEYKNPGRTVLCTPQNLPHTPLDPWKQTKRLAALHQIPMTFDIKPFTKTNETKKGKKKSKQNRKSTKEEESD